MNPFHVVCVWVSAMLEHRRFGITGQVFFFFLQGDGGTGTNHSVVNNTRQGADICIQLCHLQFYG